MTTNNFCFYLQNRLIQTSQTGGQRYSDTSPFSIPWLHAICARPCMVHSINSDSSPLSIPWFLYCLNHSTFWCDTINIWCWKLYCANCTKFCYILVFLSKKFRNIFFIGKWKWKVKWAEVIYRAPQTFPEQNNPERNNPKRNNPERKNPKCKNPPKPKNPESGAKLGRGGGGKGLSYVRGKGLS